MAGIYIHIPFCRQKCHYCNFHFSISQKNRAGLIQAIVREIEMQKDFLDTKVIETLYFGGGTPSILSKTELGQILDKIKENFTLNPGLELTLEANPDDLNPALLEDLLELGVNRLSIGVQSFMDDDLTLMNRSHTSDQARAAIRHALAAGFEDLTIDLIFGMPNSTIKTWKNNLEHALEYPIPHFSLYNLTVEKKTALDHLIQNGTIKNVTDQLMAEQFLFTIDYMENAGFEHYEISNYALPGRYARHNTAYWKGVPYLGIGPSAHSYNGTFRQWNVANNPRYIKSMLDGILPAESEQLTRADKYNEYILTGLRTKWGCESHIIRSFGVDFNAHFHKLIGNEIRSGRVKLDRGTYTLSRQGKLFADEVSAGLFVG